MNTKQRILVVDDEERIVRMIRLNLEHDGFTVIEANNGMQAINQIREKLPNLVILDVMMPGIESRRAGHFFCRVGTARSPSRL